ncbi:MAG: prepilin-type N-terminal cleavage/methylation domain-containing protein [Ruminococcus sp.]|nr:prepilin-type N-terminal cleavage/methylation domain-containing protein [Ruminococcus sp.]
MKKKRNLKGMTLIEIIISMFILSAMALILLVMGLNADETTKNTAAMKDKISVESPYAANNRNEYIAVGGGPASITPDDTVINVSLNGEDQSINAQVYNTGDIYEDSLSERAMPADRTDDRDLRFIVLATAAPTTEPTTSPI